MELDVVWEKTVMNVGLQLIDTSGGSEELAECWFQGKRGGGGMAHPIFCGNHKYVGPSSLNSFAGPHFLLSHISLLDLTSTFTSTCTERLDGSQTYCSFAPCYHATFGFSISSPYSIFWPTH